MRTGFAISISLHGLAILGGLFLVPYDDDRLRDLDRTTTVTLITAPAPPAQRDQAPEIEEFDVSSIAAPSFNADAGPAPEDDIAPIKTEQDIIEDPSAQDTEADLTALTEEVAQPEVAVTVDAPDEAAPVLAMPSMALPGATGFDNRSESPRGPQLSSPAAPRAAPRIATFSAPPPPKPARPAETEAAETTPAPDPVEEQVVEEAAVPEEATTAVSPDPESGEEEGLALRRSNAPKARPQNFEQQIADALAAALREEQERQQAAEIAAATAAAAAEAQAQAQAQAAAQAAEEAQAEAEAAAAAAAPVPAVPVGPPLTGGERDALRLAVQACWSVPAGLEGAADLRVVLAVELDPSGRIVSQRLIEPATIDRREIQIAYDAAKRALYRCGGGGYDLPREKYEHWKNLEVAFDPKGMLARW